VGHPVVEVDFVVIGELRVDGFCSCACYRFEKLSFMLHVSFYGCYKVWQEVVAFFQQGIGGREDVFDLVSSADEGVKDEDWDENYYCDDD